MRTSWLWTGGLALAVGGIALGWTLAQPTAQAQMMGGMGGAQITMAAAAVGNGSHAWAIDPRTSLVLFCSATTGAKPVCTAAPLPGTANR